MTCLFPSRISGHDSKLAALLIMAMGMPMLLLYAVAALGPQLVTDLGAAPASLGLLTLGAFAVAAALSLRAGALIEWLGARHCLSLLFGTVALMFALMAVSPGFDSLVPVVALAGLAQAVANPVTNLLIAQRVAQTRRAFMIGLKQSGVQLAAMLAGLLLPSGSQWIGWRGMFALTALLAALLALSALRLPVLPGSGVRAAQPARACNRPLALLMAIQCCVGIVLSAFIVFLPLQAAGLGMQAARAGNMVALFGAMGMLSRLVLTPLSARLGEESLLLAGLLLVSALSIALSLRADAAGPDWLWLAAAGVGLSAVAANAVAMSMLVRDAHFGPVAHASSLVSAAFFAGMALGPVAGGALIHRGGGDAGLAGWGELGVLAMAIVLSLWLARERGVHRDDPGRTGD